MIKNVRVIAAIVIATFGLVVAAANFVLRKNRVDVSETSVMPRSAKTDISNN